MLERPAPTIAYLGPKGDCGGDHEKPVAAVNQLDKALGHAKDRWGRRSGLRE